MAHAREILGVEQTWLGFIDSGLPQGDPLPPLPDVVLAPVPLEEAARALVKVIRTFRPHVVTTYDENGGSAPRPHPLPRGDDGGGGGGVRPGCLPRGRRALGCAQGLLPHDVPPAARMVALDKAMHEHGLESPYAERLKDWPEDPSQAARLTTFVPCGDYFSVRDDALRAHATQIDPDGFWFVVPLAIQQKVWPTEDYQLVKSRWRRRCRRTTSSPGSTPTRR